MERTPRRHQQRAVYFSRGALARTVGAGRTHLRKEPKPSFGVALEEHLVDGAHAPGPLHRRRCVARTVLTIRFVCPAQARMVTRLQRLQKGAQNQGFVSFGTRCWGDGR